MPTIRHILFPHDFSAAGTAAIPYVRSLANRLHAQVTLLSVVPPAWVSPPGIVGPPAVPDPVDVQGSLERLLEKTTLEGLEKPPGRITALGDPAEKIAEFTRDNAVDLVMMPTHGHGLFRRLLIGSVTSKVLHDVNCPVWTAAHAETQHSHDSPRKILCTLDASEKSVATARWAADFARQLGASLQFLHVVQPISDWLALESEQALQEQLREQSRNRMEGILKEGDVNSPLRIAMGEIVATITEQAHEEGADLVILGRGAIHEPLGGLRTHAHAIIQRSPCPVLSV
ncbi:MAG TPA: universal stress protein [Bryobacteraceae bacterium]|nr:universal stress protein [Bryobacteraceae bacterium]